MKQVTLLLHLLFFFSATQGQISVRVKESPRGREVELQAKTKPSPDKGTTSKTGTTQPATTPADTTARPATNSNQDAGYSGPAKVAMKSFRTHMEKIKAGTGTASSISNAERMIQQIKEKDPSYDIAALEAELKPYKEKAAKEVSDQASAKANEQEKKNYFKEVWQKMINVYSTGSDIQPGVTGENYYNRVKELNLDEYKQKRTEAGTVDPKSYAALVDAQLADYDEYVKRADRLKWNVVSPMTASRNAANPQDKTKLLENARYECQAVLLLSPNNTPFKQKLDEINKLLGAAGAEAAKFYTSDFHKENLNKIIWSTKPLVAGKEKEMAASIKNEFKTGEYIYGIAYLGINAKDAMNNNSNLRVRIRVDGGTAIWGGDLSYIELPLSAQDKSYIQFALLPDAQWLKDNYAPYLAEENWTISYFLDELARSGDISHKITCELIFPTSKIDDIESELSLDLGGGSAAIKAASAKLHNELMASRVLPKAGMSNVSLEQQMVAAANNLGWNDKFLKAIITSSSWSISKNELTGVILHRWVGAVCTIKGTDGKCYYQEFSFRQDYTGGGNYSNTVKYNSYGGKREIGCDKLK